MKRMTKFFICDIWQIPIDHSKPLKAWLIYFCRILLSAWQGFYRNQGYLKASHLTYYTLLAIVPILAVAFGIAKGFGFEIYFERQLYERFHEQKEIIKNAVEFAHNLLKHTKESLLVTVGFITLFWTVLKLVGNIERALNEVWSVKKARSLPRKLTDYFTLIIFCPFFFVFSSSAALFVISQISNITKSSVFQPIVPAVAFSIHLGVALILSCLLFTFIYTVMPNTKVKLKYGIFAGIFGGSIYQVVQWIYISFQVGVSKYGAVYGSFAALPLFLIWVHLSWLIFLFGAEIGCSAENESYVTYKKQLPQNRRKKASKTDIAVLIVSYCVEAFCSNTPPPKLSELSNQLQISYRFIREIADQLVEAAILSKILDSSEPAYQPAKDVSIMTLKLVLHAMNPCVKKSIYLFENENLKKVQKAIQNYDTSKSNLKENILVKSILN